MSLRLLEELWVDIVKAIVDERAVPHVLIAVLAVLLTITHIVFAVYA